MFEDRVRILNETGRILLARFGGQALSLAEEADWQSDRIAALACDQFPSFRDIHRYRSLDVPILKRAQIFASDLAETMTRNKGPAIQARETLTAFADYRVPQILRHLGILLLDGTFERQIEAGELIPPSSDEETELRACTIHAVERMKAALLERRKVDMASWLVDEYLWYHSHDSDVVVQHHKDGHVVLLNREWRVENGKRRGPGRELFTARHEAGPAGGSNSGDAGRRVCSAGPRSGQADANHD